MNRVAITLISFLIVTSASASNLSFLNDAAPIADFNKDDVEIMENTIQKALNEIKDGEKLAWKNEKTSHSGLVNPLSSYITDKKECREVRIVNKSKKRIAQNNFKFCKENETWILIKIQN